jgi:hypothetical protein
MNCDLSITEIFHENKYVTQYDGFSSLKIIKI